ncbi:MAG: 3-oxoacyl-[acyl-carrier-protein] synthase III C-terminal domain-containing protein [bacterium]|nr:3-oxoacyl-[acyl-carrier-protein] synthase III C-terminal domain-containing protein [bacterium]
MPVTREHPSITVETTISEPLPKKEFYASLGGIHIHEWYPEGTRTNRDIALLLLQTRTGQPLDEDRILKTTGVRNRHIAGPHDTVQSMARHAFAPIADEFGNEIVGIAALTSHPDDKGLYPGQNHAASLATYFSLHNLLPNLDNRTANDQPAKETTDIHIACSSGAEAVAHFGRHQKSIGKSRIAIVGAELYTPTLADPTKGEVDPSHSYAIFGDGAGAISYRPQDLTVLGSLPVSFDPNKANALRMQIRRDLIREPALWLPIPVTNYTIGPDGAIMFTEKFSMDGNAVYEEMVDLGHVIDWFIDSLKIDPKDIAAIIPHQASSSVLEGARRRLREELREKFYINLEDGNYSSISLFKALGELIRDGRVKLGDIVILAGFGAGLFASLQAIKLGEK